MDFDNSTLKAGEIAFYLAGNHAVDASRFAALLDCFAWTGPNAIVPPYELDIVELKKGSIFAKLALRWSDDTPNDRQLDLMVAELERLRGSVDKLNVTVTNIGGGLSEDGRRADRKANWSLALGALGLLYTVTHDFADASPNRCATVLADLMEKDEVPAIKMWSPDCAFTIEKRNVPEVQRRERMHQLSGLGIATGAPEIGRPTFESAEIRFPRSAYFPNGADTPPDRSGQGSLITAPTESTYPFARVTPTADDPRTGPLRMIDTLMFGHGYGPQSPDQVRLTGKMEFLNGLKVFHPDDRRLYSKPILFAPEPPQDIFTDDMHIAVEGKLFRDEGVFDILAIERLERVE